MKELKFSPIFKASPPDDSRVPSLQTLSLKALISSKKLLEQDPRLSVCAGSLKQEIVKEYKAKHPKFAHIYEQGEKLLETTTSEVNFEDICDPQHIIRPFAAFKKHYDGEHWNEIEFWALQKALHLAVDMTKYLGFAGDKPFVMMPYVQVFDTLLRQKYKAAGFVNGLFMVMLNQNDTGMLLPYAMAMQKSLQAHPEQAKSAIPLLQLIPNCMLCTADDLTLWVDHLVKQSLIDAKAYHLQWFKEEHGTAEGVDEAFDKVYKEEAVVMCDQLFETSENDAPEPEFGLFGKGCSLM